MKSAEIYCNTEEYIKKVVPLVNWDFNNKFYFDTIKKPYSCRKHHWYLGTFPPELPYSLIEIISKPSAKILDPFSGIGTTFFQSLILGRVPFAIESCHVSYQFLNSFVYLISHREQVAEALFLWEDVKRLYNSAQDYASLFSNASKLEPWFHSETLKKLCYIKEQIDTINNPALTSILFIVISNSLRRLSSQNKGWGFIADNVFPKEVQEKPVFTLVNSRINSLTNDLDILSQQIDSDMITLLAEHERIFRSSIFARKLPEKIPLVDAIITSPPYPNMADYARSQKLSYYYWDFPLDNDIKNEFGDRRSRSIQGSLSDYEKKMFVINTILVGMLKESGYLCYVLPEFTDNLEKKKVIFNIIEDLEKQGMKNIISFTRSIPSTKRTNNSSLASLREERVAIFRKEKS